MNKELIDGRINTKYENIITYLILIIVCFVFGFIYTFLMNSFESWSYLWRFLTIGLFFFGGSKFVELGAFNSLLWKIIFLLMIPLFLQIDNFFISRIFWYTGAWGTAYYTIFTLGFIFKKVTGRFNL